MLVRPNAPTPQLPSEKLLELLADSANANLSNREIGRRLEIDHKFVAGFRAALKATRWGPSRHGTFGRPPSGTQSRPGRTVAGEPPALNSWDCWVLATAHERSKFVDAVGMRHLLAAAPAEHRRAFHRVVVELAAGMMVRTTPVPPAPAVAALIASIPADLSIPDFLKRTNAAVPATAADEPAPCNGASSNQVALTKESNDVG